MRNRGLDTIRDANLAPARQNVNAIGASSELQETPPPALGTLVRRDCLRHRPDLRPRGTSAQDHRNSRDDQRRAKDSVYADRFIQHCPTEKQSYDWNDISDDRSANAARHVYKPEVRHIRDTGRACAERKQAQPGLD